MQDAGASKEGSLTIVLGAVAEGAKLREEHVIRRLVLRVILEHRPLEVLHRVGLTIRIRALLHLRRDGITLLDKAAMRIPILKKVAADRIAGFWEEARGCLRVCETRSHTK